MLLFCLPESFVHLIIMARGEIFNCGGHTANGKIFDEIWAVSYHVHRKCAAVINDPPHLVWKVIRAKWDVPFESIESICTDGGIDDILKFVSDERKEQIYEILGE